MLQRWDPVGEARRIEGRMNHLWRLPHLWSFDAEDGHAWAVPVDVTEERERVIVRATIPGIKPEDVEVTIEDGILTVQGHAEQEDGVKESTYLVRERRTGHFRRVIQLPETVDAEKAETHYEQGVLTVTFPKLEGKKARRLSVKVA